MALSGCECVFCELGDGVDGRTGFLRGDAHRKVDTGVASDVAGELALHAIRQLLDSTPGADQEEIVATGKHGINTGKLPCEQPRQPDGEEGIDLP